MSLAARRLRYEGLCSLGPQWALEARGPGWGVRMARALVLRCAAGEAHSRRLTAAWCFQVRALHLPPLPSVAPWRLDSRRGPAGVENGA